MRALTRAAIASIVVLLTVGAGSGASATSHPAVVDLSTRQGVNTYLRSLGFSQPEQFVVQRGGRNYAGARCPGMAWSCTKATRVIQIAGRAGRNLADCVGTEPICEITQIATSGGNTFTCNQQTPTAGGLERCIIIQKVSGGKGVNKNTVSVTQSISQSGTGDGPQSAQQVAQVTQNNDSGVSQSTISQTINQSLDSLGTSVAQQQAANQEFAVAQCAGSQTIPADPNGINYPRCNTASKPTASGSGSSNATQSVTQNGKADSATTGTQLQESTMNGHVDQWATSNYTSAATQTENQQLSALGPGVLQTQLGPMGISPAKRVAAGRTLFGGQGCCSNQGTNKSDTFSVSQTSTQSALLNGVSSGATSHTEEIQKALCVSSGTCTKGQKANQFNKNAKGSGPTETWCSNGVCSDDQNLATALAYSGAGVIPVGAQTLAATLSRTDTSGLLGGQDVTFKNGATTLCTARTNASGVASCQPTTPLALGEYTITASFAGAGPFMTSLSTPASVVVFAYLAQGSFVISTSPAATWPAVTFWTVKSSDWSTFNPLATAPPSSFGGFADGLSTTPPTCGGTWSFSGGSTVPPAPSISPAFPPPYMATIATSSITKTSGIVNGDIPKLVVVKVTGYSTANGGTGTGTVVGTQSICG